MSQCAGNDVLWPQLSGAELRQHYHPLSQLVRPNSCTVHRPLRAFTRPRQGGAPLLRQQQQQQQEQHQQQQELVSPLLFLTAGQEAMARRGRASPVGRPPRAVTAGSARPRDVACISPSTQVVHTAPVRPPASLRRASNQPALITINDCRFSHAENPVTKHSYTPTDATMAKHPLRKDREGRHQQLLLEERESHRCALDRVWQRLERSEQSLADAQMQRLEAYCQRDSALLQALVCEEERDRLACVNEELSHRIEMALWQSNAVLDETESNPILSSKRCTIGFSNRVGTGNNGGNATIDARLPPAARRRSTGGRQSGKPTRPRTARPRLCATPQSSPSTMPPSLAATVCAGSGGQSSPVAAITAPSARPVTGHVRDSALLRALQAAERRVVLLETMLKATRAASLSPIVDIKVSSSAADGVNDSVPVSPCSLPPFDPLMPNIMVITSDEEKEDTANAAR